MGDEAIKSLAKINTQLREAVLACFPSAYEQYVTIQMPGAIIDTRLGGSFLTAGGRATADIKNKIMCNEAMLVDSMVPLDKIMLGPTGKSVTRSYMTALDMLVPRKTDISSIDVASDVMNGDGTSKYSQAMNFLRSKETILTPKSEIVGSRLRGAKDKMEASGISGTVVDRYVEKQLAWSKARGDWDAVRSEAIEAREAGDERQSAALFSSRQKDLKRAQGVLHARWMDWVVNGDKFRVEYCFSVVDRDSIMARIERAREATRDSLITSIDGTEWAQVYLEPSNWAEICRAKAVDWRTRNPANPAHLQLRLEGLKRMKQAYSVYETQLSNRSKEPVKSWETIDGEYTALKTAAALPQSDTRSAADVEAANLKVNAMQPFWEAMKRVHDAEVELTTTLADNTTDDDAIKREKKEKRATAVENIKKLKDTAARAESGSALLVELEATRNKAWKDMYKLEADLKTANEAEGKPEVKAVQLKLEAATKAWKEADLQIQAMGTKSSVMNLEGDGIGTMKLAIAGQQKALDSDIEALQRQLESSGAGLSNAPDAIIGVGEDKKTIIRASESGALQSGSATAALGEESADVWSKVAFNIEHKTDTSSTKELAVSGSASVAVGNWWASVKASTSVSSSSKKVESAMSSCSVGGSFSAMVVNIKRPWLHSDLFQDFDIDIPEGTKLSPGAAQIKEWVNNGDNGTQARTEYGKFPAYPTAFIVAADTVLEFKMTEKNSEDTMSALSTDSSIQASYGPWGLKGGGSVKTDSKESAQKLEVKDGSLRISFQAPQIIGWVSEILPQLPRGKTVTSGGLTAPPSLAFRV